MLASEPLLWILFALLTKAPREQGAEGEPKSGVFSRNMNKKRRYHPFMNRYTIAICSLTLAIASLVAMGSDQKEVKAGQDNPVELGTVSWQRDLKQGIAKAKKTGRDIFLLFQEVPG